jgi:hypothetical protein
MAQFPSKEIEQLFKLKRPFTHHDIIRSKNTLTNQINSNTSLGIEKQREILFFIDTITQRITNKSNNVLDTALAMSSVIEQGSNFIIENPSRTEGKYAKFSDGRIATDAQKAPAGYLNPINVRSLMQAVSIDSRFRPNYYTTKSTNFNVTMPSIIKNVISMRVAVIEMPMTFYAISKSSGNANLLIIDNTPVTSTTAKGWLLTLPDGNYEQSWSNESKASHIETIMNNSIFTAVPVTINNGTTITPRTGGSSLQLNPKSDICFTIDRTSGRAVFATPTTIPIASPPLAASIFSNGFTIRFNVDNEGNLDADTNIQLRLGWQLGFRSAQYICSQGPLASPSVGACVSEGICLITGPRYGFLSIDDYQKNSGPEFIVAYGNSVFQDNIITRMNLCALQADVGVYKISSDPGLTTQMNRTREYFGPVDIQRLHISLFDEYGRIIDLNNMDWSFTLAFEQLYT